MSDDDEIGAAAEESAGPTSRATKVFFGHDDAEQTLLAAYRSGRIPHAWLIGGPPGIGKATLAYRMARFALAHPDPAAPAVQNASSLAVDADHPVTRRIASQSHTDLLVLERVLNDRGKLNSVIRVEDARRSVSFFGSTAGEGGWRVAIIDTVEELHPAAMNALLKVLEEPPPRSLFLLVTHAPGGVLPTIRSRCRRLLLRPLSVTDVKRAVASFLGRKPDDAEIMAAAQAADGSVARALAMLDGDALELRQRLTTMFAGLPSYDLRALHALGDALAGPDQRNFSAFVEIANDWLSERLRTGAPDAERLVRVARAWEKVNQAASDVDEYNLDKKPFVFTAFGLLAEAARG